MEKMPIKRLTGTIPALIIVFLLTASFPGAGQDSYGCYMPLLGTVKPPDKIKIEGAENTPIHRVQAKRPPYYLAEVPDGRYRIIVHYLTAGDKDNGFFKVQINGKIMTDKIPCFEAGKAKLKTLEAASVECDAQADGGKLKIRFPRTHDQQYAISAIEALGDTFKLRINCGGKEFKDSSGKLWKADRELPFPDVTIKLDPCDKKGEWVDIGSEMLEKLNAEGADPVVKWNGTYTRNVNGIFTDRSGNTYVNFSGIGLWRYGGPGGTLERADAGIYTSVFKSESTNPYGPGFVLFCSHGFNDKKAYQALAWDGKTIETWPLDGDVGTVDWSDPDREKLLFFMPRHNNILVTSKDSGKTRTEVVKKDKIVNVGALGDGVLVYAVSARKGSPEDGIYRSPDMGKTWEKVSNAKSAPVNCSPIFAFKERAYFNSTEGLLKSADRGKTWRLVPDSPVFTYAVQPAENDTHLLGFNEEGGFESKDQGVTWKKIMPAPPTVFTGDVERKRQKWLQSHNYYSFEWDCKKNIVYAFAPDAVFLFALP